MQRSIIPVFVILAASSVFSVPAQAQSKLGGGFIEFLAGGSGSRPQYVPRQHYIAPPQSGYSERSQSVDPRYAHLNPSRDPRLDQPQPNRTIDPRFLRREVEYQTKEAPGTIVIDTPNHFLYLVEGNGKAMRYGIGVGRPGFTWSGVHKITGEEGMAGLGAAEGDAGAATLSAASHGWRPRQSAWRARDVPRLDALPYSRLQPALDDRSQRVVRLYSLAQCRRSRSLQPREHRRQGGGALGLRA